MNRDALEAQAKDICPAELWFDLMDGLDAISDAELETLIAHHSLSQTDPDEDDSERLGRGEVQVWLTPEEADMIIRFRQGNNTQS